ncbi:hypothetical protein IU433_10090 [Nocardia puris]|uniref:Uncharacterized protein n=1 Tax=Nocardia puris TaxID=208602 RepID=A0A366DRY1_9NOCA|nr:hypothetical protein [Nocardia puris]MBF6210862.1 hypothetical protein [Nocardia puris]MBF6364457.1 hypothetical protein [Nocardia puris]MBF6459386.1 hypothetical protein [Nocardia puris]RBO92655.1 hypothetical protein DFR74_103299 [Nocardia puris]
MNVLVIAGLLVFLLTFIAVLIGVTRRSNSPEGQLTVAALQARLARESDAPEPSDEDDAEVSSAEIEEPADR